MSCFFLNKKSDCYSKLLALLYKSPSSTESLACLVCSLWHLAESPWHLQNMVLDYLAATVFLPVLAVCTFILVSVIGVAFGML